MKKYLLVFFAIIFCASSFGQSNFSLHFAQTYSWFKFVDSKGKIDENIKSDIRSSYGLNYSKVFKSGIFIRPELGYKNWGANSILKDQKLEWNLHYIDLNCGIGYIFNKTKLKPFAGASIYASHLYKADQTIGVNYYNMLANAAIKTLDYGVTVFGGVRYAFSDLAAITFEYRNNTGLNQLEPNKAEGQSQKLFNRAMSFHFGISFFINKK